MDALEGVATGVDLERFDRFPAHEGREQATQSEDVVEMSVGNENPVQAAKPDARLKDLPLRPLSTVDQEAVLTVGDNLG